ncbi:MAG: hypothetical protein ACD_62C00607G0005 [uncultured bacterium]|nr:MAG: hypothetical protein ACD_62C00607G0005 [uncultured bacterium]
MLSHADIINEMNSLALSLEGPRPFVKWVLGNVASLMECQFAAIATVRHDTVQIHLASCCQQVSPLVLQFRDLLQNTLHEHQTQFSEVIYEDSSFVGPGCESEKTEGEGTSVGSFYVTPLRVDHELLGYFALGHIKKNAFPRFKKNLLDDFCIHLSHGIRNLLNKSLIIEQMALLEQEKHKTETEKRKLDIILAGMKEGLILSDARQNVLVVNRAACDMLGLENAEGQSRAREFIVRAVLDKGTLAKPRDRDVLLKRPERQVLHISASPIVDEKGIFVAQATLLTDVTREREVERMKSEFVSVVSHELRTPLTAIREAIALIIDGIAGTVNDKQRHCLDVALRDVDRLGRMINDLLDLSRIESGKIGLKRISCSAEYLITCVHTILAAKAQSDNIQLVVAVSENVPPVFADPDTIIQVLINLVGNAFKFTPEGGTVRVSCGTSREAHPVSRISPDVFSRDTNNEIRMTDRNFVEFSVTDTGPGIPESDQKKLFQKFSQLDMSVTHRVGGTGLGLAISKELVEKHGGTIRVVSDPGKGSCFSFTIPVFTQELFTIDLIQKELDRVRDNRGCLAVILMNFAFPQELSSQNREQVLAHERALRSLMRKKEDVVCVYLERSLLCIVEANQDGANSLVLRIRNEMIDINSVQIAVYPADGQRAEDLFNRVTLRVPRDTGSVMYNQV